MVSGQINEEKPYHMKSISRSYIWSGFSLSNSQPALQCAHIECLWI